MSGIAGILALDGNPVVATHIEAMTLRLERRGPDGTRVVVDRVAALGHTLLATTPEALVEQLPLTDASSGCTITADARIDNREELLTSFGLANETRTIGDGELILRAYLAWGDECPTHLLGDFAFAIWDPRSRHLLCARDHIGMRQLIYHHDAGRRFIVATEVGAILDVPDLDAPLNYERIVDFVGNMEGADLTSTFFRGIHRLPPAHLLTVDDGRLTVRRYWELTPEPTLNLPSDQAYEEALRKVLGEAVRCRLRSAGPVGAMVSGGIDSNAVAALAAEMLTDEGRGPLATFSAIGPDPARCPETLAIMAALQSPLFAPTTVNHAALGAMRSTLAAQTARSDEPFDGSMVIIRAVYLAAQQAGIKIIFDGTGGDLVLISDVQIRTLLRQGRLREALREARGERRFWGPDAPAWRSLVAAAWQNFVPTRFRAMRFWRGRRAADRHFLERLGTLAPFVDTSEALARRQRVQQRDFDYDRLDSHTRVRPLVHPNLVVGRERYDRVAAACGIEPRDPYLDLRVIRFCLSLPREQLQKDGWIKWILRRVMQNAVPPEVIWHPRKDHVGGDFIHSLFGILPKNNINQQQVIDSNALNVRYENIYLSNWFATMLELGWATGTVAKEGSSNDDRSQSRN